MKALYGEWDYTRQQEPTPYDDTDSYRIAGDWLSGGGATVEDWGCGTGWASRYLRDVRYVGVDGAASRWTEKVADLRRYTSDVPRIFMRHVLEHNADWRLIAENLTESWHERAALVLFIPPSPDVDYDLGDETWPVPDLAVSGPDLFEILARHGTRFDYVDVTHPLESGIQWDWEGVILMERA